MVGPTVPREIQLIRNQRLGREAPVQDSDVPIVKDEQIDRIASFYSNNFQNKSSSAGIKKQGELDKKKPLIEMYEEKQAKREKKEMNPLEMFQKDKSLNLEVKNEVLKNLKNKTLSDRFKKPA